MADTIAVINEGTLHQIGAPLDIYNRPADEFVARFVGDPPMNFLSSTCSIIAEGGEPALKLDGLRVKISPRIQAALARQACDALRVGIRPSDIRLAHAQDGAGWTGEVYLVEQVGRSHVFNIKVNGDMLKVKTPLEFEAAVGNKLQVSFEPDKVYLFDAASGKSMLV
jgi:multiple sugar transport system ATP-binding protein